MMQDESASQFTCHEYRMAMYVLTTLP